MRLVPPHLFLLCLLVPPLQAYAAAGDDLVVTGSVVNLRAAPSEHAEILLKLARDRIVVEVRRDGDWVEVYTERTDISTGWVHASLLAPVPESDTALTHHSEAYARFIKDWDQINQLSALPDGSTPFTRIEEYLGHRLRISASAAWLQTDQARREQTLADLFKRWTAAVGAGLPAEVVIVDPDGNTVMSMYR